MKVKMVNCNAASYWNLNQRNIEHVWPWNYIHAMQNSQGNLDWILEDRNNEVSDVVLLIGKRYLQGWDVREAKEKLYLAADSACRHRDFGYRLTDYFWSNINEARRLLQG